MEYIVYEQKGAYAVITISREKALNALNSPVSYTHLAWCRPVRASGHIPAGWPVPACCSRPHRHVQNNTG